ncbi:PAS fold-4 domain-containing protein [Leptolyngbya boryana NIES-2135]|uniref:PAS fold-4 domain-containing protein n=1 Tax=Leptolyngbya boryana NIES-2135 TaxID=1973484 RepID=A0A1Z4JIS6_LEPBY|nr:MULTISPECIES: PAS domain-containing protein [Leptolyngbya]BAY56624.1 PAS fold-4 domain-containing protein [Leptolyngbya boryana NIES-2135]MBD2369539.1 PAS domain-containing protein [Leptolyngbya sp. FACHB-161]MBD2377354.1 PAS domain-containing protein [Leptolyngbya sp. FACHB-238]MBD2401763.1 PAS domain-containing protein [Leptolyngbya sp. FACHB-239]MBD2408230.1 PAS domain-containing protein [Leptolyngbya sp. FACHB-402]
MNLETVLEYTSDAITALDTQWNYICVNHSAELLLRRKRNELLGRSIWAVFPDLLNTPAEGQLRQAAAAQVSVKFELFLPKLYAWHEVRAVPTENGLLLFSRDISDRVRALRDEAVQAEIRAILEQAPISISIMRGPEHRIEMHNRRFQQLIGGRNLEGLTVRNAFRELEGQGFFELLDQVYTTGVAYEGKEMVARYDRDGSGELYEGYFNIIYQPLFDLSGQVDRLLSLNIEVTEEVKARQRIARFATERDAILQQLIEGVIVTDVEGRITFVNDAASRLHGVAQLDVLPEDYSETYHLYTEEGHPYPAADLPLSRAVFKDEVVKEARWRIRRPDETEILVEGNARPVYDEQGRKIAAVLTLRAL